MNDVDKRVGYEDNVGRFRAPAIKNPEKNRSFMVQELLAFLHFADERLDLKHGSILDYGCGTGLALQWINSQFGNKDLVGIDISPGAIESARSNFPGIDFRIFDAESPIASLKREFDVALCLNVLEHLYNPDKALYYLANHYMKKNGYLVSTVPNRMIFSNGMMQSPINKTHINEPSYEEFRNLLENHFNKVDIFGVRFKEEDRRNVHAIWVRHACDGYSALGELWWNPILKNTYRLFFKGELLLIPYLMIKYKKFLHLWSYSDLELIHNPDEVNNSIWFFAIASNDCSR